MILKLLKHFKKKERCVIMDEKNEAKKFVIKSFEIRRGTSRQLKGRWEKYEIVLRTEILGQDGITQAIALVERLADRRAEQWRTQGQL